MKIILIQKQETDPKLMKRISIKRNIPMETVIKMLRYNVFTANQIVALTGMSLGQVMNLCRDGKRNGKIIPSKLTRVGIMAEFENGEELPGRMYILRDENTEKLLIESNR